MGTQRINPHLDAAWWARGLTLAERLGAGAPDTPAETADARDVRRLTRWRTADQLDESGTFDRLLTNRDLTENRLLALLGEDPAALARRCTAPDWVSFVEEVLAHTPHTVDMPAEDGGWQPGFAALVAPFVARAWARVVPASAGVGRESQLRAGFEAHLTPLLVRLAARTLVLELNVARVAGRLDGATPGARFMSFVRQTAGRAGLTALLREYVVLARLLATACRHAVDAYQELLRRLAADREQTLVPLLGGDPGDLTAAKTSGDLHQRGRFVAVLQFASGAQVIYRPRPPAVHRHVNDLVRWLDAAVPGLGLRTLAVADRGTYGWVEFAPHEPCATADDVARFYRRLGAYLALLYAVDATDMHCENVVASGDQPMLVDLETLPHPALPPLSAIADDPAATALESSVYRSVLLPRLMFGERGAVDLSALGGDASTGDDRPLDAIGYRAAATDEMWLAREAISFPGAQNRPRLADADIDPAGYLEVLLAGFRDAYQAIVDHRSELLARLDRCAGDEVRVVVRATRLYATLLDETTHPDVLRDALDRDHAFDVLWRESAGEPVRERVIRYELADLWQGDVPYFTARAGATDLYTSQGVRLPDIFHQTGLQRVAAKVAQMGELDRADQEWIIRAALATRERPRIHHAEMAAHDSSAGAVPDPERLVAAAVGMADQLLARAYRAGGRVNWLGLEPLDDRHWSVQPLGAGLSTGYTGVALFLAQLSALTGIDRYAECAARALSPVPALLDQLADAPAQAAVVGCGGYDGLGGLAYGLARIGVLLGDPRLLRLSVRGAELVGATADKDGPVDLLDGISGGLAASVAVHGLTGEPAAWEAARRCADILCTQGLPALAEATAPTGFGRGLAGVAMALLGFAAAGGGLPCLELGLAAADQARRMRRRAVRGGYGWCGGPAGDALAMALGDGPPPDIDLLHPLANHSLCHGELGNLEPLLVAANRYEPAAAALTARAANLLGSIERYGPRCATPGGVDSPGLLTGVSGVGYGLLRLAFPDRVPSVLLLQT